MKRDEILKEFTVDERGIIRNPGQFELCPVFGPHFWDVVMNGLGDESQVSAGVTIDLIDVTPEDVVEFPELAGVERIAIWKDCVGFIHYLTKAENFPLPDGEEGEDDE